MNRVEGKTINEQTEKTEPVKSNIEQVEDGIGLKISAWDREVRR